MAADLAACRSTDIQSTASKALKKTEHWRQSATDHWPQRTPITLSLQHRYSYHRGTAQSAISVEILSTASKLYETLHLKWLAIGKWPWRLFKVIRNSIIYHFLLVVCSNVTTSLYCTITETLPWLPVTFKRPSIWHDSWHYGSRTLCNSCANISWFIHAIFSKLWALKRFQTTKVTFKVTQGHWYWCHLICHIRFPVSLPQCHCPEKRNPLDNVQL